MPEALPDLRLDEDVVFAARPHWSQPARRSLLPLLLLAACLTVVAGTAPVRPGWPPPWSSVTLALVATIAVGAVAWLAWTYLAWAGDRTLITTQRIIRWQHIPLVRDTRRDIALSRVRRATVECHGLLATWLGTGTLAIDTVMATPVVVPSLPAPERAHRCLTTQLAPASVRSAAPVADAGVDSAPDEPTIDIIGHEHWWRLLAALRLPVAACLLTVATTAAMTHWLAPAWGIALLVLAAGVTTIAAVSSAVAVIGWRGHYYGLTNDELVEVVRLPWRAPRAVPLANLIQIHDLAYRVPHPLAHLLDYGDITLTTGDRERPLTLSGIARPRQVHRHLGERLHVVHLA